MKKIRNLLFAISLTFNLGLVISCIQNSSNNVQTFAKEPISEVVVSEEPTSEELSVDSVSTSDEEPIFTSEEQSSISQWATDFLAILSSAGGITIEAISGALIAIAIILANTGIGKKLRKKFENDVDLLASASNENEAKLNHLSSIINEYEKKELNANAKFDSLYKSVVKYIALDKTTKAKKCLEDLEKEIEKYTEIK